MIKKNKFQHKLVALNCSIPMPSETVNPHIGNAEKIAFTLKVGLLAHNIITEWNKPAHKQDFIKLGTSITMLTGMLLENQNIQRATSFFRTGMYAVDTLQVAARVLSNIASTPFFVLGALASQTAKLCGFSEWISNQTANVARGYLSENVIPYIKELLPLVVYTVLPGVTTEGENGVRVHTILLSNRYALSKTEIDTDVFYDTYQSPEEMHQSEVRRDAVADQGQNATITGLPNTGAGTKVVFLNENQLIMSAPQDNQGKGAVYILPSNVSINLADGFPEGATNISSATGIKMGPVVSAFDINGDTHPDGILQAPDGLRFIPGAQNGFPAHVNFDELPKINGTLTGDGNVQAVGTVDGRSLLMASRVDGTVVFIQNEAGVYASLPADSSSKVVSSLFTHEDKVGVGTRLSNSLSGRVRSYDVNPAGQNVTLNTTYEGDAEGARLGAAALSFVGADGTPILVLGATGEQNLTGALHVIFQNGSSQVLRGEIPGGLFGSTFAVAGNQLLVTAQNAGAVYKFDIGEGTFPSNLTQAIKYSGTPQSFGFSLAGSDDGNYVIGDPKSDRVLLFFAKPNPITTTQTTLASSSKESSTMTPVITVSTSKMSISTQSSDRSAGPNIAVIAGAVVGGIVVVVVVGGTLGIRSCRHNARTGVDRRAVEVVPEGVPIVSNPIHHSFSGGESTVDGPNTDIYSLFSRPRQVDQQPAEVVYEQLPQSRQAEPKPDDLYAVPPESEDFVKLHSLSALDVDQHLYQNVGSHNIVVQNQPLYVAQQSVTEVQSLYAVPGQNQEFRDLQSLNELVEHEL